MDQLKLLPTRDSSTPLRQRYHQSAKDGKVYYSRELQVQTHLENVVNDVIESCNYDLKTDREAALNGLKVDIGIIRNRNDIPPLLAVARLNAQSSNFILRQ